MMMMLVFPYQHYKLKAAYSHDFSVSKWKVPFCFVSSKRLYRLINRENSLFDCEITKPLQISGNKMTTNFGECEGIALCCSLSSEI